MTPKIVLTPIALKLHAFGLTSLHDPNWTGRDLYYHVKDCLRRRTGPAELLRKPLRNGLLFQVGHWLLTDYFIHDLHRMDLGPEHRLWYLEDLVAILVSAGVSPTDDLLQKAVHHVSKTDGLFPAREEAYWRRLKKSTSYDLIEGLIQTYQSNLEALFDSYAANYAERVFHDRQLCEHISRTLVTIGFDGSIDDSEIPAQWCERPSSWPSWVPKAVGARDRGSCAACGTNISLELDADGHIDHIVPLARGGTNDLSNLQLLCSACNLAKSAHIIDVQSSIPQYLQIAKRRGKQSIR